MNLAIKLEDLFLIFILYFTLKISKLLQNGTNGLRLFHKVLIGMIMYNNRCSEAL